MDRCIYHSLQLQAKQLAPYMVTRTLLAMSSFFSFNVTCSFFLQIIYVLACNQYYIGSSKIEFNNLKSDFGFEFRLKKTRN